MPGQIVAGAAASQPSVKAPNFRSIFIILFSLIYLSLILFHFYFFYLFKGGIHVKVEISHPSDAKRA